jgi:16S rRNA (adenine1518-N6/adenine1519-N6)-dimethyltransferase
MNLVDKTTIKNILKLNKIWSKKSLGQNFLVDKKVLATIIDNAELKLSDDVLEIGPGLGTLTRELCHKAGKVISVEKDEKCTKILKENTKDCKNLEIINQDILEINEPKLPLKNYKLVANIPYNITGAILRKFLESKNKPYFMILMVQKEVAKKIVAEPGNMSILAVSVQFYARPELVQIVSSQAFWPKPKVDSAILKITEISPKIYRVNERDFFRCVRIGFSSPRKTLLNNLAAGYRINKERVKIILQKVNLGENIRAQELTVNDWQVLSTILKIN